mgnify:FL=1
MDYETLKSEGVSERDSIKECINNLNNYYANKPGVISTETGKIAVGFLEINKDEIINVADEYGLNVVSDYGSFVYFNTPIGKEIFLICSLSNDDRIKNKIEWAEPNFIGSGGGAYSMKKLFQST